jgi:hypothetical protein
VTTTPISIQSQPSTDGSLFRILAGPNPIPTTGVLPPNIKGRIYYEQLLPKEPPIPIANILSSDTLHICVSGTVNRDNNSSTSSWWFSSSSVDYSAGHTIRGVCPPTEPRYAVFSQRYIFFTRLSKVTPRIYFHLSPFNVATRKF